LRPEYVGKFSIQSAWIKRTAKITTTRKAIVTEIENLLSQQKNDDEAEQLRQQRTEMIRQLCEVHSQSAGLKTPLLPCDVGHLVAEAPLPEISGIIIQACHDRLNLEQKAAREAAAVTEPPLPPTQPSFQSGPPLLPPAPSSFQSGPPLMPEFVPVPPPPMPPVMPSTWDVVLKLPGITIPQANGFKAYLASNGMSYEVISQEPRGNR
ncbi:hypothetical protein, partial [Pelorhabdus rhamnosifermentans]|uniref:hypothetical protein n=1 Tax=Pelorhabdus rhamnosifermentans TaxID=2772457 RepID=UPI001C060936